MVCLYQRAYISSLKGHLDLFDNANVIYSYTWQQAVEDGSLVEIFKNRWPELSGGKPI